MLHPLHIKTGRVLLVLELVSVDLSHGSKIPETWREISLRSKKFEVDCNLDNSGLSLWVITNCSKSITKEKFWETACTHDRALATGLLLPWMWRISEVNWDMKSRCWICLGEWQLGDDDREYVWGLWSVTTWKWRPSSMSRKCLIERYINSSPR